jgi:hypothetical protein
MYCSTKVRRYWRLVRSVCVGRRVIQQTVAHLGEIDGRWRRTGWLSGTDAAIR